MFMVGEINAVISPRLSFISWRVNRPDDGGMLADKATDTVTF
jgi:hypothetical protein